MQCEVASVMLPARVCQLLCCMQLPQKRFTSTIIKAESIIVKEPFVGLSTPTEFCTGPVQTSLHHSYVGWSSAIQV